MAPDDPSDDRSLADLLAEDLGTVLGRPVGAVDLRARRDGALAPVIGMVALTDARRRQTASRLLVEWAAASAAERTKDDDLRAAPVAVDLPGLTADGEALIRGLRLAPPDPPGPPALVLRAYASTIAELAGGIREVVVVTPGATAVERMPGWVARLRLLGRGDELGRPPADPERLGEWICAVHENASSVYVPEADGGSLWRELVVATRDQGLAALNEAGQSVGERIDLSRSKSESFRANIDRSQCVELTGHPDRSGNALQIIRLPRRRGTQVVGGAALLAPGD